MSQLVNFSALQYLSSLNLTDQLLFRIDNSLSGADGFGRAGVSVLEQTLPVFSIVAATSSYWNAGLNLTASFQSAFNTVNSNSANWNIVYTTSSVFTTVQSNSANWNSIFTTGNTYSANWNSVFTTENTYSANWNSNYTYTNTNSGNWQTTFTTVRDTSAAWNDVIDKTVSACNVMDNVLYITDSVIELDSTFAGKTIICDADTGCIVYVPPFSVHQIAPHSRIRFIDFHGTGYIVFSAHFDSTINSFGNSLSSAGRNAEVSLLQSEENTWFLTGKLKE